MQNVEIILLSFLDFQKKKTYIYIYIYIGFILLQTSGKSNFHFTLIYSKNKQLNFAHETCKLLS